MKQKSLVDFRHSGSIGLRKATQWRSGMSWQDIMRRVLPHIEGLQRHITSSYGATNRPAGSTNPHGGIDFNYNVPGQRGINLAHPALRSPVTGVVTSARQGAAGRIAIRDANGFTHEILHSHRQHVTIGDPVVAGQLIGTMGNTGVSRENPDKGDHHVHYQLKDPAGKEIDPSAFWNQQGRIDLS
jgi:murein DD-endopeptidase MepM/ murein hydrolase activator NlpD